MYVYLFVYVYYNEITYAYYFVAILFFWVNHLHLSFSE